MTVSIDFPLNGIKALLMYVFTFIGHSIGVVDIPKART